MAEMLEQGPDMMERMDVNMRPIKLDMGLNAPDPQAYNSESHQDQQHRPPNEPGDAMAGNTMSGAGATTDRFRHSDRRLRWKYFD